jgi:hypothetical protein
MRSRIKDHRKIRAGDLLPHELNPRTHTTEQRQALSALYRDIGFARSLLAYELPDGRLKLIDGHLRRETTPDEIVDVEVLDVTDDEARALLLSLDPLAQLAGYDGHALDQLRDSTKTAAAAVTRLWEAVERSQAQTQETLKGAQHSARRPLRSIPDQWLVIVECADENEQVTLLREFKGRSLRCSAKTS